MTGRVFLVRHGNTFASGEAPRRIGARTDLPLVDSGVAQADALGRWFAARDIGFTDALAGPLRRARQTADLILGHLPSPPPLRTVEWLNEIDHGPDEDCHEAEVLARVGEQALADWDERGIPPTGWIAEVPARLHCWRLFMQSLPAGDTLVVTSNGAARFAFLAHPELVASHRATLKLRTGACAEISRTDDGSLILSAWDVRPGI